METIDAPATTPPAKTDLRRIARTIADATRLAWRASPWHRRADGGPDGGHLGHRAAGGCADPARGRPGGPGRRRRHPRVRELLPWVTAMGALAALRTILASIQGDRQELFAFVVNRETERLFVEKTSQSDLARFDDPAWHDRVQRVSRDINFRTYNVSFQSIGLLGALVTLTGMLGLLLSLHRCCWGWRSCRSASRSPFSGGSTAPSTSSGSTPRPRSESSGTTGRC